MSNDYCLHCGLKKNRPGGCADCGPSACGIEVPTHPLYLPPGTLLNHDQYQIGRVLGAGGFGVTYLAIDVRLGMRLAIKELLPVSVAARSSDGVSIAPISQDTETLQAGMDGFLREAKMLIPFNEHPNIVSILNFFEENGTAYLVMPYLDGVPLDQFLEQRGSHLPEGDAIPIVVSVLDAIRATHAKSLLHRDIKPSNVFLTADGMVKLLDFGSARQMVGERTKTMTAVVTEGYAPFEQYQTRTHQGPATDIYAAGATAYKMLTGETPQPSLMRLAQDSLVPPHECPGVQVSPRVSNAIMCAMAVKPEERFQTADAFLNALEGGMSTPVSQHPAAPTSVTPPASDQGLAATLSMEGADKTVVHPAARKTAQKKSRQKKGAKPLLVSVIALWGVIALAGVGYLLFGSQSENADGASSPPTATPPNGTTAGIMSSERPFVEDVNADGTIDFIGRYREFDRATNSYVAYVVALDGNSLKELWRSKPVGQWPDKTGLLSMYRYHGVVLLTQKDTLTGYDIDNGKRLWQADLPAIPRQMAKAPSADLLRVQLQDNSFVQLNTADGKWSVDNSQTPLATPLRSDEGSFQDGVGMLGLKLEQWPGMAVQEVYCQLAHRKYEKDTPLEKRSPLGAQSCVDSPSVAFATREKGQSTPYLVGYEPKTRVKKWQVQLTPPGTSFSLESTPRLQIMDRRILAGYVFNGTTTVHLLEKETGTEIWKRSLTDDPMAANLGTLVAANRVFVHNGLNIHVLNLETGEVITAADDGRPQ